MCHREVIVIRVAEAQRPRLVCVENVPELLSWKLYRAWRMALTLLGYRLSEQILDAADCGVPQERRRLFVVGVRARKPFAVPLPSMPRVNARAVIDLDTGSWRPWAAYAPKSVARIRGAIATQGSEALVAYYGSLSSHAGRSLDRPIGTLTTHDRYVVVRGDVARVLTVEEQLALQGFPRDYPLTGTRSERVMQVGNAVAPPVAEWIARAIMGRA